MGRYSLSFEPGLLRLGTAPRPEIPRTSNGKAPRPSPAVNIGCTELGDVTMAELPHPWSAYARLSRGLSRRCCIDGQSWGAEAALNQILILLQQGGSPSQEDIGRMGATARRGERHRAHLRLVHLPASEFAASPEAAFAARDELTAISSGLTERDWTILSEVSAGRDYSEVASLVGGTVGALRVRVARIRKELKAAA